ncbi:MAG TPA: hypothetical protein VHU87_01855 [Rhizomicrobium sp.]|jgi:hypothetical protein|nr:hypothetical protein [Rhizomicrobium sp.]
MTLPALQEWRDFYVMVGTASGVIVGATFVVATLASGLVEKRALGMKGFITPTTVHLGSVLVGSAILTVPTLTALALSILLGAGALGGVIYGVIVYTRITRLNIDLIDRCWYGILPILAYGLLGVAAWLVFAAIGPGLELVATALVLLLIAGMRNAWDMATFMIMGGPKAGDGKG